MTEPGSSVVLECRGSRRLPRPLWRFVQGTGFVVAGLTAMIGLIGVSLIGFTIALAFAALPLLLLYSARNRTGGEVELEAAGLRWRGREETAFVPTEHVVGGHLAHKVRALRGHIRPSEGSVMAQRGIVLLLENGAEWHLDLEDKEAAEKVLEHLGLGAGKRAVVAPLRGELGAFTRGLLAMCFSMPLFIVAALAIFGGQGMVWAGFLASVAFTAFWVQRYGYPRVVVGSDGIRLIGRIVPRFLSFGDIESAEHTSSQFASGFASSITLVSKGRRIVLPLIGQSSDAEKALIDRIHAGMSEYAKGGRDRMLGALARAGRSVEAWKSDLERIAQAERGFRQSSVGRDDFESVLLDPSAAADQRLGAALALRYVDEEAGPRIRVAAEASANPRLRGALEAAAEGEVDEAALHDALIAQRRA